MAEALARRRFADLGIDVSVRSAGFLFDGRRAEPGAEHAMAKRGLDLRGHRSRIVDADLLAGADLVIGMEQRHVREAAVLLPDAFSRTYALLDLLERAESLGYRRDQDLGTWQERLGVLRTPESLYATYPPVDVPDPMGQSNRAFRRCADQLDTAIERFVELAWITPDPTGGDRLAAPSHPWRS